MKKDNNGMSLLAITAICSYAIIAVASDIFANKMVNFLGLTLAGGFLLIPFSFTIRDLLHRIVGYKNTKKIVWATAILNLVIAVLLVVLDMLPAAIPGMDESWHMLMGASWRIIIASFLAQLISDLLDTYVFEWFTKKFGDKHTWLRVAGSNLISVPADTVIFSMVAFWGIMEPSIIWASVLSAFVVKYVISVIATPIAYLMKKVK